MEVEDVFQDHCFFCPVFFEQFPDRSAHSLGLGGFHSADFIGQALVFADCKPILLGIRCAGFQDTMDLLYYAFGQRLGRPVYDEVYTAKMVDGFDYIINSDCNIRDAYRVCLEDIAGLFFGQPTTLNVVGIIGQLYLRAVVDSALYSCRFLLSQSLQKRRDDGACILSHGQWRIGRNAPCFADKNGARQPALGAIVAHCPLGYSVKASIFFG